MILRKLLFVGVSLLGLTAIAQPTPSKPGQSTKLREGITMMKPYWVLGESREVAVAAECITMIKDSLVNNKKAKWDGQMEIVAADGKTSSVSITERVVENGTFISDLVEKISTQSDVINVVVKMDKTGKIIGVDNLQEVQDKFIEDEEKFQRSEGRKFNKEEKIAFTDSIKGSFEEDNRLKMVLINYARNFLNIYGKEIPSNADTLTQEVEIDPKRFFAQATKKVKANSKVYQLEAIKGSKFTVEEVLDYRYDGFAEWILANKKLKNPVLEEATWVTDKISTTYDTKVHWPQRINEELTIRNGKYKLIVKWSVKFNKPK